jgi:cell division protein FtsN
MGELKKNYPNSIYVVGAIDTQPVEIEQPTPAPTQAPARVPVEPKKEVRQPKESPAVKGKYALQTGAFSTQQSAQKQIDFLAGIHMKGVLSTKQSGEKKLFVVTVEGFASAQEARAAIADLQIKHNLQSIIIIR